jgi:NAD(P)-dependent dehydrogenase (short-subunit alcohol dehydrogenase family)
MEDENTEYAVVTGAGSGIGRGIALALAEAGYGVLVADLNFDAAQAVAQELTSVGCEALSAPLDTSSKTSVASLVEMTRASFPRLDVLINSAGVMVHAPLIDATDNDWGYIMSVNLFGIVNCCTAFAPWFIAQQRGHIVNNASQAALVAHDIEGLGLYTASKHACLGYTESLRNELIKHSVGVSVLCPGRVESNLRHTSTRNRPDRYGGPMALTTEQPSIPDGLPPGIMTAEACGRIVVNAIREQRFLIITHPERWKEVQERYNAFHVDNEAERRRQAHQS